VTVLVEGALANSKITQHLKEAMESLKGSMETAIKFMYPVPRHPRCD
jgi:hypothetical protein